VTDVCITPPESYDGLVNGRGPPPSTHGNAFVSLEVDALTRRVKKTSRRLHASIEDSDRSAQSVSTNKHFPGCQSACVDTSGNRWAALVQQDLTRVRLDYQVPRSLLLRASIIPLDHTQNRELGA